VNDIGLNDPIRPQTGNNEDYNRRNESPRDPNDLDEGVRDSPRDRGSPAAQAPNEDQNNGNEGQPGEQNAEEERKNKERAEKEKNEAAKKKDVKTAKTSHFVDKNLFVAQHRSNLLTMNDRHQLEQDVMK
jgi:hypothetical protein